MDVSGSFSYAIGLAVQLVKSLEEKASSSTRRHTKAFRSISGKVQKKRMLRCDRIGDLQLAVGDMAYLGGGQ